MSGQSGRFTAELQEAKRSKAHHQDTLKTTSWRVLHIKVNDKAVSYI